MKIIVWEDLNIETNMLNGNIEEVKLINVEIDSEDEDNYEDGGQEFTLEQIITTPFGVYHVKDFFNPMRQYRWNMAHTNFDISKSVLNGLCSVSGVERVVVLSRYRFLIAFAKAFSVSSVKDSIYKTLGASQPLPEDVLAKKKDLSNIYDKWAIYYLSDRDWEYADESSYEEKIKYFRERQENENGIIITHETDI